MDDMERIKNLVKDKGYKLTPQRKATLETILQNAGRHLSTEEIFWEVKKICPDIGLATVYRTILLLDELNILDKHNFEDGRYRYELNHPDQDHHHHHLICNKCGKVFEVEEDLLEDLEHKIEQNFNFRITNHKVQFFGYCSNCIEGDDKSI
ncbi:MAG TPA: Fur family transcriptional regulator [Candidatus Atribacteria bacterium]|nr:Fur family transcriptional regulator [Candidatus Atribacteria bacterium]HPT77861.1 Fur family transcriptional regulator [Candidatus Atribacteria bacterium]